jgi:hypothetical protein
MLYTFRNDLSLISTLFLEMFVWISWEKNGEIEPLVKSEVAEDIEIKSLLMDC